jgi:hypothetical protein
MKARTLRHLFWLVAAAVLLAGCPYGSEFPLGSSAEAIADPELLGVWHTAADSEENFSLTMSRSGGAELLITADSPGEESESYMAFVSAVGGEFFLNIQDAPETGQWYFANYRLLGERLLLRLVDDVLFEPQSFASPEDLRAFLLENLDNPGLYGGDRSEEWDWELERSAP